MLLSIKELYFYSAPSQDAHYISIRYIESTLNITRWGCVVAWEEHTQPLLDQRFSFHSWATCTDNSDTFPCSCCCTTCATAWKTTPSRSTHTRTASKRHHLGRILLAFFFFFHSWWQRWNNSKLIEFIKIFKVWSLVFFIFINIPCCRDVRSCLSRARTRTWTFAWTRTLPSVFTWTLTTSAYYFCDGFSFLPPSHKQSSLSLAHSGVTCITRTCSKNPWVLFSLDQVWSIFHILPVNRLARIVLTKPEKWQQPDWLCARLLLYRT